MFETACIPMLINKATLRREMDDEESYRVADVTLLLEPFSRELAAELGEHIAAHLFEDDEMRPEVEKVNLSLNAPDQRVIVASAPDAPALAELKSVTIGALAVTRKAKEDHEWYRATIEARIDLREREIREFLFHHFGELRVFTFYPEQTPLFGGHGATLTNADTGEVLAEWNGGAGEATH
ncbi:MAG TPA: hypothetical protein VG538_06060 [Vicinamibacterales bacterium]|jgi:hypothetical protein|nr:hypothetical protein [Vicinamibacterales bacterium]